MEESKSRITTHIHGRVSKLAAQAKQRGLIVQCDRTDDDTYLLLKPGELTPTEYGAISTGVILLSLLEQQ